ncbi:aldose 1-epimerase family protein [Daejeonella oryzae]|uniref:aldose 1-epimerase family protein n=1 Tax=Daejeonella oryzae TaxID=1122943 RepID=UPI0004167B13|nr:aldose 1-epimerase family protein [Daejeonella oryzae]
MIHLENEFLKVSVRNQGAELTSFYNNTTGIEHLWQADPSVWGWYSPNLFPVVGGCLNNQIVVDGMPFKMERHGFARNSTFKVIDCTDTHAVFELNDSVETHVNYPYKFTFQVIYDLLDNELKITYKVINRDNKTIYFSVGAHPAFRIPFDKNDSLEDYYLEFERDEVLEKHLLSVNGFFNGMTEIIRNESNTLLLSRELFKNDALVFKNLLSRELCLKSLNHSKSIYLKFPQFNYLGIWAKDDVPFICLEPWLGCADTEGKSEELKNKEAIQVLAAGQVFEADYRIGVL